MKVEKNKVVSINYTLTNDKKEVVDTSEGREPLTYMQGNGNLIPGLEKALEGQSTGYSDNVTIAPAEAYGERSDELIQDIPITSFQNKDELKPGAQFQMQSEQDIRIATVISVADDMVKMDLNHPMAGETLHFAVEIMDIRDASEEELSHGHVHGPDGHHHH